MILTLRLVHDSQILNYFLVFYIKWGIFGLKSIKMKLFIDQNQFKYRGTEKNIIKYFTKKISKILNFNK